MPNQLLGRDDERLSPFCLLANPRKGGWPMRLFVEVPFRRASGRSNAGLSDGGQNDVAAWILRAF